EDAKLHIEVRELKVRDFVSEVLAEWELRMRQARTKVSVEIAPDVSHVAADPALLKRVFSNLVQNAIVHSGHPVTLRLTARSEGDGVLFALQDDGPGIPSEYLELIFRKFETLGSMWGMHAPRVRSSGLGLAFCKLAMDAHHGRIWASSRVGEGSTFYLYLHREPSEGEHRE